MRSPLAAVFDLNHAPHIVHWHVISVPLPNVIVVILMFVVFFAAILLPFPGAAARKRARRG
ncbi:MAG TPA: hypothetical protein VMA83_02155 [Solirubrobacteraceae bacterium]|nr:hypothetical protein [Solirubrobacteraceae bacterium]